jgi:hypothetical protein
MVSRRDDLPQENLLQALGRTARIILGSPFTPSETTGLKASFAFATVRARDTRACIAIVAGTIFGSSTWRCPCDYGIGACADLVIDETSVLQFRYLNNLLIARNTYLCGRLHEYETFIAFLYSRNDMLNLPPSASRQRSFGKQKWTSVAIRYL